MVYKNIVTVLLFLSAPCVSYAQALGVYFSPDDNIKDKLLHYIEKEQASIKGALYLITDKDVAIALGTACKRGVHVELVICKSCLEQRWHQVDTLRHFGIPVHLYDGGQESIMHNKFFVFERNGGNKKLLWTGSYNATRRANKKNRENVIVQDDHNAIVNFEREFEHLKKLSQSYAGKRRAHSIFNLDYLRLRPTISTDPFIGVLLQR